MRKYNKWLEEAAQSIDFKGELPKIVVSPIYGPTEGEALHQKRVIKLGPNLKKKQAGIILRHELEHIRQGPKDTSNCRTTKDLGKVYIKRELEARRAEGKGNLTIGSLARILVDLVEYENFGKRDSYILLREVLTERGIPKASITRAISLGRDFMLTEGIK